MRRVREDESGQVIVEFVIVFALIATLIFLFVQMSWGIAWGHYVQYSTYMASRAYMAAGNTQADQTEAAKAVLLQTVKAGGKDIFPFLAPARVGGDRDIPSGGEVVPGAYVGEHPAMQGQERSRLFSWAEGVQYNFSIKMFLLPISSFVAKGGQGQTINPGGGKALTFKGMIPMTSDSFLGREPTTDECISEMHRLSTAKGINRGDSADFIEDNGC